MTDKPQDSGKPQFRPFTQDSGKPPLDTPKLGLEIDKELEEARKRAEMQKIKTTEEIAKAEETKAKQEQAFYQSNIKDVEDLNSKLADAKKLSEELGKEKYDFEQYKAKIENELAQKKFDADHRLSELTKRELEAKSRLANVETREALIKERYALLNKTEQKHLADEIEYNSKKSVLQRNFPRISGLLGDNANILIKSGFANFGNQLWDEIEQLEAWSKNDFDNHVDTMIEWLQGEINDCNTKAVQMSREPKTYDVSSWNGIVDNLEEIYSLMPLLKPQHLPSSGV